MARYERYFRTNMAVTAATIAQRLTWSLAMCSRTTGSLACAAGHCPASSRQSSSVRAPTAGVRNRVPFRERTSPSASQTEGANGGNAHIYGHCRAARRPLFKAGKHLGKDRGRFQAPEPSAMRWHLAHRLGYLTQNSVDQPLPTPRHALTPPRIAPIVDLARCSKGVADEGSPDRDLQATSAPVRRMRPVLQIRMPLPAMRRLVRVFSSPAPHNPHKLTTEKIIP
jgi:hypothetical protein